MRVVLVVVEYVYVIGEVCVCVCGGSGSMCVCPLALFCLQLQLVGDLGGDVLKSDGGAGDALEPDPVEGEARQLAHLDLPLDERVGVGVAVHAQEQEALALLVVAVVRVEDLNSYVAN